MDPQSVQNLTSAVAPVVLVSAAGLIFNGVQSKNLHLSDRIRALTAELRNAATSTERRAQIADQLPLFARRIRLSQHALELIYIAMLCFIMTALLLAAAAWPTSPALPLLISIIFVGGVSILIAALILEFIEMWVGLKTIAIETRGLLRTR